MARDDNDNETTAGGGLASSTAWWAAGGVIVLVIIGLLWILLSRGGSGSTATPTRTVTASPSVAATGSGALSGTSSPSSTTGVSGCSIPGGSSAVPVVAPTASWQAVGAVAAPVSTTLGPFKISGNDHQDRTCFQHSPAGAVLAAINTSVASVSPEGASVVRNRWTAGPGKNEIMGGNGGDSGTATIAGFQVQSCDQSSCLISVAYQVGDGVGAITMPMVWVDGDWKVNGQLTGLSSAAPITNLSGYVVMSPGGAS